MRCNSVNTVCEEDLGCSENGDCGAGEVCNTGSHACVPRCTVDTQGQVCAASEKCVNERCAQCATNADCTAGLTCDAAGRCVSGARCYTDRDCKIPFVCHVQTGACLEKLPPCTSNESCLENQRCDVSSGRCVPRDCQPDRYEPNNEATQAFGIAASRYNDLTLCQGDVDWYSVSLSRGDELGVNLDADPFSENSFSTVIKDGTGRTLASGKLLVSHVASAAQVYYVAISSVDLFQVYDVSFLITRGTPCDDDAWEPNDSVMQATALNNATSIDGAVCPQDADHFRLDVPAGKGVKVSFSNYNAAGGLLRLCVLDGETVLSCSDEAEPVVEVPAATAGGKSLYARVVGSTERIANAYTLEVEFP
jgi:Cys-rich repeat protein